MPNGWVEHVKAYAAKHNLSYRDAMMASGDSYIKKIKVKQTKQSLASCQEELAKVKQQLRDITRPERHARKAAKKQSAMEDLLELAKPASPITKPPRMRVPKEEIRRTVSPMLRVMKEDFRPRQDDYPT